MSRRRNGLLEGLFELISTFWQVGAVVATIFGVLTVALLIGITNFIVSFESTTVTIFLEKLVWGAYIAPIVSAFFSYVFAIETYRVYRRQNCI